MCFSYRYSLATIGVCVFCAVTSVAVLFIFRGIKIDKAQLVQEMAKSFYDEYREKCKNLTDRELQEINLKNTRIVGSTPVDTNNFQTISRCYADGMVCKEILERRKKYSDAIKNWRNNLNKRKEEAILSLPVATSELGQLIAAILEFKGELKLKEICACVNEYIGGSNYV